MSILISSCTAFLIICAFLSHIFSLPANWFILLILALWAWIIPNSEIPLSTFALFGFAALAGEIVEFVLQSFGAHKHGASRSGNWGAFCGAILGAILGAPFFLGLGALIGAICGAYFGCLGIELLNMRPLPEAKKAAMGAMLGKVLGMAVKIGIGMVLLIQSFKILF